MELLLSKKYVMKNFITKQKRKTFFDIAKNHKLKTQDIDKNLSLEVDKIVYGI